MKLLSAEEAREKIEVIKGWSEVQRHRNCYMTSIISEINMAISRGDYEIGYDLIFRLNNTDLDIMTKALEYKGYKIKTKWIDKELNNRILLVSWEK